MAWTNDVDAGLAEIAAEIGVAMTWSGNNYTVLLDDPEVGLDLDTGGFQITADYRVKVRRSILPSIPTVKDAVVIATKTYRIQAVTNKPTSPQVILHLKSA